MFNNAIKKFASVGLVFSLCVPCCFASAQKMPPNLFIPSNSGGNRTNQQNWGNFNPFLRAMQQATQLAQPQPSALERLWNEYDGREYITIHGRHFNTAGEFANEVCRINTPLSVISRGILHHLIAVTNIGLNEALTMTQEIIIEIYNLDKIEAGRYAMQALAYLKDHPILSKFLFK